MSLVILLDFTWRELVQFLEAILPLFCITGHDFIFCGMCLAFSPDLLDVLMASGTSLSETVSIADLGGRRAYANENFEG